MLRTAARIRAQRDSNGWLCPPRRETRRTSKASETSSSIPGPDHCRQIRHRAPTPSTAPLHLSLSSFPSILSTGIYKLIDPLILEIHQQILSLSLFRKIFYMKRKETVSSRLNGSIKRCFSLIVIERVEQRNKQISTIIFLESHAKKYIV